MVAKNAFVKAAECIDRALQEFVHHRGEAKVLVYADELGHLHAVVATHAFDGVPGDERVRRVWEFLRSKLPAEDVGFLYRIHALTGDEYDARIASSVFPGGKTEILDLDENPP